MLTLQKPVKLKVVLVWRVIASSLRNERGQPALILREDFCSEGTKSETANRQSKELIQVVWKELN